MCKRRRFIIGLQNNSAFTLIELLVVIAIIAILAVVVILTLNPAELLRQSRDSNRVSDMSTLVSALNLYSDDQSGVPSFNMGSKNTVYISIPDLTATSTAGDQCQGLGLLALPSTYTYHCAASSTYRNVNGTGWIPVNLSNISSGSPLGSLPVDPTNNSSSRLYYTYTTNGTQFEFTAPMESQKYGVGGSNDVITPDGGPLATVYAKGSSLSLEPLDYADPTLSAFWALDEGTGTVAYDYSGNNNFANWSGTQSGSSGYYTTGKIQSYAGYFDGSDDDAAATSSIYFGTNSFTTTAWVNTSDTGTDHRIMGKQFGSGSSYMDESVSIGAGTGFSVEMNDGTGYTSYSSDVSVSSSTWDQVVLVVNRSANTVSLYVNGVLELSTPHTYTGSFGTSPDTNSFGIGYQTSVDTMQGAIAAVRVYDRALSSAQIAAMYSGGK